LREKPDPQAGMRVRIDAWDPPGTLGTILEVLPYGVRVAVDGYRYDRNGDAHSFTAESLTPVWQGRNDVVRPMQPAPASPRPVALRAMRRFS
jgi:hypothetical protein